MKKIRLLEAIISCGILILSSNCAIVSKINKGREERKAEREYWIIDRGYRDVTFKKSDYMKILKSLNDKNTTGSLENYSVIH